VTEVVPLVDEGLGNSAYLVDLGDGRALAVDASRDLRAFDHAAARRGLRVAFAADTHLHADFVSGATDLASRSGAIVLASAAGCREHVHRGVGDGDEIDLGGLTLRVLATPGHTHEHVAFELLDGARTLGVFTGGSLLVGSAARTDLVDPARTEELARSQYHSLQRLARLDDAVTVWPTHGAGSFCSAPPGQERATTIGAQRSSNALLAAGSEDEFVSLLLSSLGTYPAYFRRLPEVNRHGPAPVPAGPLARLTVDEVSRMDGVEVVDVRPFESFASAHVPGSLANPLRPAFATWLGWLVDPARRLVVVRDENQDPNEILWQARKVGLEPVGELAGGVQAWIAAGHPTRTIPLVDAGRLEASAVLDVRQSAEFESGHVPSAHNVELGDLSGPPAGVPPRPTVVMCGHGERAMTAASLLARTGRTDISVLAGGPEDWAEATGRSLQARS
jgi:glyoxylase-like metal-dependent hydrolase (beta-lactamase superfamily II)/rhodanese-related sulfurtransferase